MKCEECIGLKDDLSNAQSELNDLATERASNVQQIKMLKAENDDHVNNTAVNKSEIMSKDKDLQRSLRKIMKYKVCLLLNLFML